MTAGAAALALGPLLALAAAQDQTGSPSPSPSWELDASLAAYLLPAQPDYLQPTVTADRGWLHLEARYSYEDRRTGSLFVGGNHQLGHTLTLELTPMLGGVFGRTNGIAPALELALRWDPLELSSQSEFVVDLGDTSASFFYSWSEATVGLGSWGRAGVAVQRTKIVSTPHVVSVGPMAGASVGRFDATVYWFDPFASDEFVVIEAGATF
jgi:hypothetical protein